MKLLKNVFQVVRKIPKEKGDTNEGSSLQEEAEYQEKMILSVPPLGDLSGSFEVAPVQDSYKENSTPLISSTTNNNDNINTDLVSKSNSNSNNNSNNNHDNDDSNDESFQLEMVETDTDRRRRRRRRERKSNSGASKKIEKSSKGDRTLPADYIEKSSSTTSTRRSAASSRMLLMVNNDGNGDDDDDDDDDVIALSNNEQRKAPTSSLNLSHHSISSNNGSSSRSFIQLSFDSNSSTINSIVDGNGDKPSSSRRSLNSSIISDKPSSSRRSLNDSSHSSIYSNSNRSDDDDDQKQLYFIDDFDSDIEGEDDDHKEEEEEEKEHGTKVNNIPVRSYIGEHLQAPVVLPSTNTTPNIRRHRTRSRDRSRLEGGKKIRSVDASSSSRRGNGNEKDRQRRYIRSSNKSGDGEKSYQSETTASSENRELESEVTQITTDSTKEKVYRKKISNTETFPDKEKEGISRNSNSSRGHRSSRRQRSSSEDQLTKSNTIRSSSRDLLGISSSHLPGRRRRSRSSDKRRKRKPGTNTVSVDSQKGMTKLFGGTTQSEEETVVASNFRPKSLPDMKTTTLEESFNDSEKVDKNLHSSFQEFGRAERRARRDKNTEESRKNRNTKRVSDRTHHRSNRRSKDKESDKKDQTRSSISQSIHKHEDPPENTSKQSSYDDSAILDDSQGPIMEELGKIIQPSKAVYESDSQNLSVSSIGQGDSNSKLIKEDIIKNNSKSAVTLLSHLDTMPSSGTQNITESSVQSSGECTEESQDTDSRKLDDEKRMTDSIKIMKIENNPLQPDLSRNDDANSNGTELKTADLEAANTRNKSNIVSETLLNENEAKKECENSKGKNARIDTTISDKEIRKSSRKSRQKKRNDVVKRDSEMDSSNSKPDVVPRLEECRPRNNKLVGKSASNKSHNSKKKSNMSLNDLFSKSEHYAKKEIISPSNDCDSLPPPSLASDVDYSIKNKTIMKSITENDSTFVGKDLFALLDEHAPCSEEDICDVSLAPPSLFGDTNRSQKTDTQIEYVIKSADETESKNEVKQQSNVAKTSTAQSRSSSSLRSDDSSGSFVLDTVDDGKFPDDNKEAIKMKKRNGMLNKMRMATSTFTESGRTTVKKAASTRNFKVFARGKGEGRDS
jgi:hypothetical protein